MKSVKRERVEILTYPTNPITIYVTHDASLSLLPKTIRDLAMLACPKDVDSLDYQYYCDRGDRRQHRFDVVCFNRDLTESKESVKVFLDQFNSFPPAEREEING